MSRTLTPAAVAQSALTNSSVAWLLFVEIWYDGIVRYRFVNNNENLSLSGHTYTAFPFTITNMVESTLGDLPQVELALEDSGNELSSDMRVKRGFSGGTVVIRGGYATQAGAVTDTGLSLTFTVLSTARTGDRGMVMLSLGLDDVLTRRFPPDRYLAPVCRHRFKDGLCKYAGAVSTCDRSITRCRELNNSSNYGGSPGVSGIGSF